MVDGWIEKSPMRDGSGIYRCNGVDYKIVLFDFVTTKQRVAFKDRKEVARASRFTTLIKRLKALSPTPDAEEER